MPKPVLVSHTDKAELASRGAQGILQTLHSTLSTGSVAHLSLTGGTMGIAVWAALGEIPEAESIDWSRVHFWWSDERFVATGHSDRNEQQAKDALLSRLPIPEENMHTMGASDSFGSVEQAAAAYTAELAAAAPKGESSPIFDLTLLGMGPDGHIASLFPDRQEILNTDELAIAVKDSPKPPPTRVSMTLPIINRSRKTWFLIAGSDKQDATTRLVAASKLDASELGSAVLQATPAAGARGSDETLMMVTHDAIA